MDAFPLFLKLFDEVILVVGGGEIACHKARMLSKTSSHIRLVAPILHPSTEQLVKEKSLDFHQRRYQSSDCEGVKLVIAATDDKQLNLEISQDAKKLGLLVNVVDMPDLGNVIFPAIVDRTPLIIAIGSNGKAPVLVRQIRAKIETLIPPAYGALAQLVGSFREKAKRAFSTVQMRRRFWDWHLQGKAGDLVLSGQTEAATKILDLAIQNKESVPKTGEVYLVGAGPGNADLLTFKALRLMQQADVVLYDRLVSNEVLELVRRESESIYVGKERNPYSITQENINQALVDLALQGKRVLRLKGGDPFMFGRGGEELQTLAKHGIPFQVVPGITAASGCAAYSGIPLTHRDYAQSVRFITGHKKGGELNLNWREFIQEKQTLVFYMGLNGLEEICLKLQEFGMKKTMPVALVEKGTLVDQRVFIGDLDTLPFIVREAKAEAPTLIIVGEVVRLHRQIGNG